MVCYKFNSKFGKITCGTGQHVIDYDIDKCMGCRKLVGNPGLVIIEFIILLCMYAYKIYIHNRIMNSSVTRSGFPTSFLHPMHLSM